MRARAVLLSLVLTLTAAFVLAAPALADDPQWTGQAVAHDSSPPLSSVKDAGNSGHGPGFPARHTGGTFQDIAIPKQDATPHQTQISGSAPPTIGNWDGVNNVDGVLPPDTNGDVSETQYFQWVNLTLRIFKKSDGSVLLTEPGNALWSGFGSGTPASVCANTNQGDPVVLYDKQDKRWIVSQFAFNTDRSGNPVAPYYQCIAVSQTSDATGQYWRYGYEINAGVNPNYFNDYPKLGVWSDGLYMTTNNFNGNTFAGAGVYAFDLAKMLTGAPATFIAHQLSSTYEGLLPAHADSATQVPPAGDAEYIGGIDTSSSTGLGSTFLTWRFKPDFTTPANTTFTGPTSLAVPQYNWAFCNQLFPTGCIAQRGTSQTLDPLADRLMNRLQYRRMGTDDVLVASHTVNAGNNQAGVRWYEIHKPDGAALKLVQGDTFAPNDGVSRWMGSAAMDAAGDIALGYSASGSTLYPSIRYTGRLFGDPLNTMDLGEGTIAAGGGAQTSTYARWGDYSSMSVDPSDDTTFWYTQEYMGATSNAGWQTRIGSFKLVASAPAPATLTGVSMSPTSVTGGSPSTGTVTLSGPAPSGGATVSLSATNGVTVPASVPVPAGATSATFTASTPSVSTTTTSTISATYATVTKTATLTVNPPAAASFTLGASPTSRSIKRGRSTSYTVTINRVGGYSGSVALSASGLPSGASASFSPSPTTGGSSTLTVTTSGGTPRGTFTLTIKGIGSGVSPDPTTTVTLQVR